MGIVFIGIVGESIKVYNRVTMQGERDTDWRCACGHFNRTARSQCANCKALPKKRITRKVFRSNHLDAITSAYLARVLGPSELTRQ